MYKKIMQKLLRMTGEQNVFDPSQLGDPIALQTGWTPAKRGGTNFRTHKLVEVNSYRIEFRASIGAKLFYLIFLLAGIGIIMVFTFKTLSAGVFSFNVDTIMPLLIGLVFMVAGGCMLYFGTVPIVFDKTKGTFQKGRRTQNITSDRNAHKNYTQLDNIHALQLISEYIRSNKNSYYSYELNLVLENGKRINVIDHGNEHRIREDAGTLSTFLNKPVWDAI